MSALQHIAPSHELHSAQSAFPWLTKKVGRQQHRAGKPFVKWAGGKTQLLGELAARFPKKFERYVEPFVGGGALLFYVLEQRPRIKALIADINAELINAFRVIKGDVETLICDLAKHRYEENYYYQVRDADRSKKFKNWGHVKRASRFIFLNKTCYNGLYRVNSNGLFNTPFGNYTNPTIVDAATLRACSKSLSRVSILRGDFSCIERRVQRGDFVYFDPPYVPVSKTASFTAYTKSGFDLSNQKNLRDLCKRLDRKKIRFMVSNSATDEIAELYREFNVHSVKATRAINSQASKRGKIEELIITNY